MKNGNSFVRLVTWLFFSVSLLDVIGVVVQDPRLQLIFKPLIIPCLILLYFVSTKSRNSWYVAALFFSFLGDVLLLDKNNMFLYGIAAFLITQLLYVFIISKDLTKSDWKTKSLAALPFLIFFTALINILKDGLGDFLVPVIIYGLAISVFGFVSLLNYLLRKDQSSLILLGGAVLFILSDSMIALHKFYEARAIYPAAIMITYIMAQYMIFSYRIKSAEK
jgi:uncharacterized membrane protein YhhN